MPTVKTALLHLAVHNGTKSYANRPSKNALLT